MKEILRMKQLTFFSFFILLSIDVVFAACMERTYSQEHLKKYANQEIQSILMSSDWRYSESAQMAQPEIIINIKLNRNQTTQIVEVDAVCDTNSNFEYLESGVTVTCLVKDSSHKIKVQKIKNKDFDFQISLDKNINFKNVVSNKSLQLTVGDSVFRLKNDSNYLGRECESVLYSPYTVTTARLWSDVILQSVRYDMARPTVTSRNLFHLSVLMWDVYASFSNNLKQYHLHEKYNVSGSDNIKNLRSQAMSYAAYTFIKERFKNAPGNVKDNLPLGEGDSGDGEPDNKINTVLIKIMNRLGLDPHYIEKKSGATAADFGIRMAKQLLRDYLNDGSKESENYAHDKNYVLKNNFNYLDIMQSGVHTPSTFVEPVFDNDGLVSEGYTLLGEEFSDKYDIDYWQSLYVPGSLDQNGNELDSPQMPLTLFWGNLNTFSDLSQFKSKDKAGVYFEDIGKPLSFRENTDEFILQNLSVMDMSRSLNPFDLAEAKKDFDGDGVFDVNPGAELIDISPNSMGNSDLGKNDGKGYAVNPITSLPYKKQKIKRADFYRSLAEFWADGPHSETPPGHWNVLANDVIDQMVNSKIPLKWKGQGAILDREQYELMVLFSLNGALFDAGIVAWGLKGYYQAARPITVLRKLAKMAEQDASFAQKLEQLSPLLKMVTFSEKTYDEQGNVKEEKMVTKLAIHAWRGPMYFGEIPNHRNYSFLSRNELAIEENQFYVEQGMSAGVGWILAENWLPYQQQTFVTPPFPGFISGHSTFSRAAAEILAGVTGSEFFPNGLGTYPAPDLVFESSENKFDFQWAKYTDAADQSGLSRIYGGIHAPYDDIPGRKIGAKIGKAALKKADTFFSAQ